MNEQMNLISRKNKEMNGNEMEMIIHLLKRICNYCSGTGLNPQGHKCPTCNGTGNIPPDRYVCDCGWIGKEPCPLHKSP